jgi:hypothetical protein
MLCSLLFFAERNFVASTDRIMLILYTVAVSSADTTVMILLLFTFTL